MTSLANLSPALQGVALPVPAARQRFIVGTWYQPIRFHALWKARGCNALFGFEPDGGAATLDQFLASAQANGLGVWLQFSAVRTPADLNHPAVVGVINDPDESDGVGNKSPQYMQAMYATIRAALIAAGRNLPVWCDFDGNRIPFAPPAQYTEYAKACDVMGEDVYPLNLGHGTAATATDIPDRVKTLQSASGGKPIIAVIECSNQDLNKQPWTQGNDASGTPLGPKMRGPTSDEFAAEVQSAVATGVCGVVYFPDQIGQGWEGFDGTPPDVEARMKTVNATLATLTVPAFVLPPLSALPAGGVAAANGADDPVVSITYTHASGKAETFKRT